MDFNVLNESYDESLFSIVPWMIDSMITVQSKRENRLKPKVVLDYNRDKSFIDVSDQMASYGSPLRKSLKWYR